MTHLIIDFITECKAYVQVGESSSLIFSFTAVCPKAPHWAQKISISTAATWFQTSAPEQVISCTPTNRTSLSELKHLKISSPSQNRWWKSISNGWKQIEWYAMSTKLRWLWWVMVPLPSRLVGERSGQRVGWNCWASSSTHTWTGSPNSLQQSREQTDPFSALRKYEDTSQRTKPRQFTHYIIPRHYIMGWRSGIMAT